MKLKDLPKIVRPRERLAHYGPAKLSNSELLAILLGTGTKDMNVVELARKILMKFSAQGLTTIPLDELTATFGLGPTKAAEIVACFELGRRLLKDKPNELIFSSKDVWLSLKDIRSHKKEHFVAFYLDGRNQSIQREIISVGTVNASLVHPREVFEPAIKNLASQIILAHNHPSGDLEPSADDLAITHRLIEAGKILGITILDHVIISPAGFLSFRTRSLIN